MSHYRDAPFRQTAVPYLSGPETWTWKVNRYIDTQIIIIITVIIIIIVYKNHSNILHLCPREINSLTGDVTFIKVIYTARLLAVVH